MRGKDTEESKKLLLKVADVIKKAGVSRGPNEKAREPSTNDGC